LEIASTLDPSAVDGVLVGCAGVQVAGVLEPIEQRLGVPVVASDQALLWHLLRTLAIPARPGGYGALLAGLFDPRP
jgi:maleate isomerase